MGPPRPKRVAPTFKLKISEHGKRSRTIRVNLATHLRSEQSAGSTPPPPPQCPATSHHCEPRVEVHEEVEEVDADPLKSKYYSHKKQVVEEWATHRDGLSEAIGCINPSMQCVHCQAEADTAVFCEDCSPTYVECLACAQKSHRLLCFHFRKLWNGLHFSQYEHVSSLCTSHGEKCITAYRRKLEVFDQRGRLHVAMITFCNCEPMCITLAKLHLWPSSPNNPASAYHFDFLKLLHALMMESHVPLKSSTQSIKVANKLNNNQARALYRLLVNESFEEFASAITHKDLMTSNNGRLCPICPQVRNPIISIDGNFGLVRKGHSGRSLEGPKITGSFLDDDAVKGFVQRVDDGKKKTKSECNDFQAGSKIRSRQAASKLDITGVFGSICRHEIPLKFLNMRHGERLAYPLALIEDVLKLRDVSELYVTYDIACMFEKFLKNSPEFQAIRAKLKLAIPVFHCYGHQASCQMLYNPRRLDGFGLTDGEGIERLWSYLRPFAKITKEMTPSHREDVLSRALVHYATKKMQNLGVWLHDRASTAAKQMNYCDSELSKLAEAFHVILDDTTLQAMFEIEQASYDKNVIHRRDDWRSAYAKMLFTFNLCQSDPSREEELRNLEVDLVNVEQRHKVQRWQPEDPQYLKALENARQLAKEDFHAKLLPFCRERRFLLYLQRKHPDGQAYSIKIQGQLHRVLEKIKKKLKIFNSLDFIAQKFDLSSVLNLDSALYNNAERPAEQQLPAQVSRRAVEFFCLRKRATEELNMVTEEMSIYVSHLLDKRALLLQHLAPRCSPATSAAAFELMENVEREFSLVKSLFSTYMEGIPELPSMKPPTSDDQFHHSIEDEFFCIDCDSESDSE